MIRQTVLVTGGAGFIGSHLCQRLLGKNFKVICFDNLSTGSLNNLQKIQPHINFIKGDCNDYNQLKIVFEKNKIDIVFHYAAVVGVKRTLENPLAVLNDLEGIRHILELSHLHQIKKVIFASSSEVYGEPVEIPEVEDGHVNA
ncbi:MAG: udp-glucose 4-epimerase, partial [Candidatus Peregrinibacteria bacterium GW2011_GWE2_39_6]